MLDIIITFVINYQPSFQILKLNLNYFYEVIVPGTDSFDCDIDNIMFKAEICQYGGIRVSETKEVVLNHSIQSDEAHGRNKSAILSLMMAVVF